MKELIVAFWAAVSLSIVSSPVVDCFHLVPRYQQHQRSLFHNQKRRSRPLLVICNNKDPNLSEDECLLQQTPVSSRRLVFSKIAAAAATIPAWLLILPEQSLAATTTDSSSSSYLQQADSSELEVGLLESRVTENVLSPPSYGMETTDIFYPSWFKGTWSVASKTVNVQAPCGIPLFGGNSTYERARSEIGTTLTYDARFISVNNNNDNNNGGEQNSVIIADREYNVVSIAKAAMGQYSVIDIPVATPNKLTCVLAPKGSPRMLKVDLIALNRRQEYISATKFDCSEVTREIVAPVNDNNQQQSSSVPAASLSNAPILKEVETTSLYTFNPAKNEITCQQRSATFLLPSQTSPIAYKLWEAARGRPIDTRFYEVRYTKAG